MNWLVVRFKLTGSELTNKQNWDNFQLSEITIISVKRNHNVK